MGYIALSQPHDCRRSVSPSPQVSWPLASEVEIVAGGGAYTGGAMIKLTVRRGRAPGNENCTELAQILGQLQVSNRDFQSKCSAALAGGAVEAGAGELPALHLRQDRRRH